jgi:hypothetical protein
MCLKRKKVEVVMDPVEEKFNKMMELIKDLSRVDYNRLKKAMDLGWQSYQTVRNVKTEDEKEYGDIDNIESKLLETQAVENSTKK